MNCNPSKISSQSTSPTIKKYLDYNKSRAEISAALVVFLQLDIDQKQSRFRLKPALLLVDKNMSQELVFLLHIVIYILHILVFFKLVEKFFKSHTLLGGNLLEIVGDAFKL